MNQQDTLFSMNLFQ